MSADAATVRAAVQMIPARPAATTWRVCPPDLEPPAERWGPSGRSGTRRPSDDANTPASSRSEFAKAVWRRRGRPGAGVDLLRMLTGRYGRIPAV